MLVAPLLLLLLLLSQFQPQRRLYRPQVNHNGDQTSRDMMVYVSEIGHTEWKLPAQPRNLKQRSKKSPPRRKSKSNP
jgi:hypothetical protein